MEPNDNRGAVDPRRCPLCGDKNACAMAEGKSTCWCFHVEVSPAALKRIPTDADDATCICQSCAVAEPQEPK